MTGRVFLVAAEASGDALGADLIAELKRRDPALAFGAIGGAAMAAQGVESLFDISPLSVLGLIEGLQAYPRVVRLADQAADGIVSFRPDAVVLIDSWGFTLRVAQRIGPRLPSVPLIKYVGPQVWASRPGRAKTLAETVDRLICIYDFERPFYAPYGLPCVVSGHPAFGRFARGDACSFRARHGVEPQRRILLILPGSRPSEIARLAPTLEQAAASIIAARKDVLAVCVASPAVRGLIHRRAQDWPFPHLMIDDPAGKNDAFAAGAVALAASGTVATEVALQGIPVIVGYKLGWMTWAILRAAVNPRFITLFNIAAGMEAAPEFVQTRFTRENLAAAAARLLDDPKARVKQVEAQNSALLAMGRGGRPAAENAADVVMDALRAGPGAVRRRRKHKRPRP